MTTVDERPLHIRQVEGLRALADMIEQNPQLAKPMDSPLSRLLVSVGHRYDEVSPQDELLWFLRAAGTAARKNYDDDRWMAVDVDLGAVQLHVYTARDNVCERVVTGVEKVTKTVPDPVALAAVPTVEVTEEVEKVEWVCRPLLAAEQVPAVAL